MLILLVALLPILGWGLKIHAETPFGLQIKLCSHQVTPEVENHMQYLPSPISYCASIRTTKHPRHLAHDLQSTSSHYAVVDIKWRNVLAPRNCHVQFKGYQGVYRIWPDFGRYESCQFAMSRHLYEMNEVSTDTKSVSKLREANEECPIIGLPSNYAHYVGCEFTPNGWHILEWSSSIRYETFRNGSYGAFWANYSTAFVFSATSELERNGTEIEWLSRLLNVRTRSNGCDKASALVSIDENWLPISTVTVTYRIRRAGIRIHTQLLDSQVIEKWIESKFDLHRAEGIHEVCAQLTSSAIPFLKHRICAKIIDQLDCPFGTEAPQEIAASETRLTAYYVNAIVVLWLFFCIV